MIHGVRMIDLSLSFLFFFFVSVSVLLCLRPFAFSLNLSPATGVQPAGRLVPRWNREQRARRDGGSGVHCARLWGGSRRVP